MYMSYWWGTGIENFLFEGYSITTEYGLFATCLMLFTFAIFFEFLKVLKARLRQRELRKRQQNLRSICITEDDGSLVKNRKERTSLKTNKYFLFLHEFLLWFVQEILGYGLMLAVMMYNGYMTVAVALGAGIGYFLFGQTLLKINRENCAVKKESLCFSTCREADNAVLISNAENSPRSTIVTEHSFEDSPPHADPTSVQTSAEIH